MRRKFYRFRPIKRLITDFKELENQSIYFASPNQLNDPMEGFRDIVWSGDHILWSNLFKHYLLCTERSCSLLMLTGENNEISKEHIVLLSSEDDLPTPMYKELFKRLTQAFFANPNISKLIQKISERSTPIRRDELCFYLTAVHPLAIELIQNEYENSHLTPERKANDDKADSIVANLVNSDFIGNLEKSITQNKSEELITDFLFSSQRRINEEIGIIHRHNGTFDNEKKNRTLVLIELPSVYTSQLEKLVYPEWYTACFMSECKNSSIWGHYGENHTGACLIFNADHHEGEYHLELSQQNGCRREKLNLPFYPIKYTKDLEKIYFFQSLGRLSISTLKSSWYEFKNERSNYTEENSSNREEWRNTYWKNFYRDITKKSDDWEYENEHRLILSSPLDDYINPTERSLKYEFSSLEGIIFGIKTSMNDKLEIIKIIEKKCIEEKRSNFKFYQAFYSPSSKLIEHSEMSLLKFSI
ncbi:DUF2971 domain-containing protein [Pseudomonas marginalis]|uniref:DUF2971 domain-containing protein n=1 Tax=Pseudomonas marginalis TaxID=298 RepID=UPI002033E1A9|nr:DUF2971 domain-containing protein [Pseudomonas marginalis]MCM2379585.1 DUF2971 domain-containing protein [Pseudomonas marginalis]